MAAEKAVSDVSTVELSKIDRLWIRKCIEFQRVALKRSIAKEVPGSELSELRGREIKMLLDLEGRFS